MNEQTNPQFSDILSLLNNLPKMPEGSAFESQNKDTIAYLSKWLSHHSKIYDFSKGFNVNRCALYWAGYDGTDGFDGKAFVESCQDGKGAMRSLASILDTDLQIFELDPYNHGQKTSVEIALAASYGMMAIEEPTQLFCVTSFGQGVGSHAEQALETLKNTDAFDLEDFMINNCGLDHAALLGNAIAAIMKGIPMVIEGVQGSLIQLMLFKQTGQNFGNILLTDNLDLSLGKHLPGKNALLSAIMLKTCLIAMR
jgi:hypothetical protein